MDALAGGAWDVGGAILLGAALALPASWLTGRIRENEPMQAEALGFVLVCGGLARWLDVSFLLSAMVMGMVLTNIAKHHERPFRTLRGLEWPLMILFFILAGAQLHAGKLLDIGLIGIAYIVLRVAGRVAGAYAGGVVGGARQRIRRWMGVAIMPQAGVALGMALVGGNAFPEHKDMLITLVVGSTVLFELVGPVLTSMAVVHAGDAYQEEEKEEEEPEESASGGVQDEA
jgi:Kef-type K+ transport system membrane component KefB